MSNEQRYDRAVVALRETGNTQLTVSQPLWRILGEHEGHHVVTHEYESEGDRTLECADCGAILAQVEK